MHTVDVSAALPWRARDDKRMVNLNMIEIQRYTAYANSADHFKQTLTMKKQEY
jgi:hypothetical protein